MPPASGQARLGGQPSWRHVRAVPRPPGTVGRGRRGGARTRSPARKGPCGDRPGTLRAQARPGPALRPCRPSAGILTFKNGGLSGPSACLANTCTASTAGRQRAPRPLLWGPPPQQTVPCPGTSYRTPPSNRESSPNCREPLPHQQHRWGEHGPGTGPWRRSAEQGWTAATPRSAEGEAGGACLTTPDAEGTSAGVGNAGRGRRAASSPGSLGR